MELLEIEQKETLRREEVAQLAGLSTDYYTRLEKGALGSASESVLEAIARALQLDDAEHAHLLDLARTARKGVPARRRSQPTQLRTSLQQVLDAMTTVPAFIDDGRLDLVGTNFLARAFFTEMFDSPAGPPNFARFCFLDPRARGFYADWDRAADTTVNMLRTEAGRNPYDRGLSDLIGELSTRSETFRNRWAAHNVRLHRAGAKQFHHPVVGDLDLPYEALPLAPGSSTALVAYTPEPGSPAQDALTLLASWAATEADPDQPAQAHPTSAQQGTKPAP